MIFIIYSVSVRLGEWDADTERDCQNNYCAEKPVDIDIEKIFVYKDQYNIEDVKSADIALIKLKEPVQFTGKYKYKLTVPTFVFFKLKLN